MPDDVLDDFLRADRERSLGVYGIHLYREGTPPVERRVRSDDRVNLYSIAKTFTAVGLAEAEDASLSTTGSSITSPNSGRWPRTGSRTSPCAN